MENSLLQRNTGVSYAHNALSKEYMYKFRMGSFAAERYVATHFWKWYEKGSKSTLLVLLATESFMIIPNFIEAMLNLNGLSIKSPKNNNDC